MEIVTFGFMKKLREFYKKYKDYIRVDLIMYLVMFLGILIFLIIQSKRP